MNKTKRKFTAEFKEQVGQHTCAGAFPISEDGQVPRTGAITAPGRITHPITSGQLVWNISPRGLSMRS